MINNGDYTKQQVDSVDKTAFYWKKMLYKNFRSREEKSISIFKRQADSLVRG